MIEKKVIIAHFSSLYTVLKVKCWCSNYIQTKSTSSVFLIKIMFVICLYH